MAAQKSPSWISAAHRPNGECQRRSSVCATLWPTISSNTKTIVFLKFLNLSQNTLHLLSWSLLLHQHCQAIESSRIINIVKNHNVRTNGFIHRPFTFVDSSRNCLSVRTPRDCQCRSQLHSATRIQSVWSSMYWTRYQGILPDLVFAHDVDNSNNNFPADGRI